MIKPTMKDVAKIANVSTATVSNVITGKKYVSADLKETVEKAMETLSFVPNITARSLRKNRTYIIGVVVPDITNPFYGSIINAISQKAAAKGYRLILGNYDNNSMIEETVLNDLILTGAEGIVYVSPRVSDQELNKTARVPMVMVDRARFETTANIGFVSTDNFLGGELAAARFLRRGFKKYICIAGVGKTRSNASQRVEGFQNFLVANGIPVDNMELHNCKYTFDFNTVHKLVLGLLQDGKIETGSAVFVCSDLGAWGAMEAIKISGLRIPEDVAVIGYDNIIWADWFTPSLTTIENSQTVLGTDAADMLIDTIETGESLRGQYHLNKVSLVDRNSV